MCPLNLSSSAEETIGTVDKSGLRSPLKYTPQPPGHDVCDTISLESDRNSELCPADRLHLATAPNFPISPSRSVPRNEEYSVIAMW